MRTVHYHPAHLTGGIGAVAREVDGVLHVLYDPCLSLRDRLIAIAELFGPDEYGAPVGVHGQLLERASG